MEKRCSECKETKSVGEFSGDKQRRDGKRTNCRACHNAREAAYRATYAGALAQDRANDRRDLGRIEQRLKEAP